MNVNDHHTTKELPTFYRTEENARLARRIHAVYLAGKGLSCAEIMTITGAGRLTIQRWVHKYNKHRIDGLTDKSRPGQPTKLPPYSHELNPVENLWRYLWSHYWANRINADYDALRLAAVDAWQRAALDKETVKSVCFVEYAQRN